MESRSIQALVVCVPLGVLWPRSSRAQTDYPRIEAGIQLTALVLNAPVNGGGLGVGARFGYNLTSHFGWEGEVNRFPGAGAFNVPNVRVTDGLFGVKAGPFARDTGLFLKARPGFIHFPRNGDMQARGLAHLNHFALDVGLVGERYFPNHFYVRLDLSDTLLAFGDDHITDTVTGRLTRLGTRNNATFAIGFGVHSERTDLMTQ
jgi:hypothetical protein